MKLLTDGHHSFNIIRKGDLANEPGNQIRYQQEASKAPMHTISIYPESDILYPTSYLSRFIVSYLSQQRPSLKRRNRSKLYSGRKVFRAPKKHGMS